MSDDTGPDELAELMAFIDDTRHELGEPPSAPTDEGEDPSGWAATPAEQEPELMFPSVDGFVREIICHFYARPVGPRGARRWSARWWTSIEAISRLESLWRAWEHLRHDGSTGMSVWWRDHADHHIPLLFDPNGPFAGSTDESRPGEPLPYEAPPPGLFTDIRTK